MRVPAHPWLAALIRQGTAIALVVGVAAFDVAASGDKVTVFNGMGLPLREHKKKGDQLAVTGRIHYSRWKDADGTERYGTEIIAENVMFI